MKKCVTQRLYWKQWPYKIILGEESKEVRANNFSWHARSNFIKPTSKESAAWKSQLRRWFKKNFPNGGIRQETRISLFLHTQEEVDLVLDSWKNLVLELWEPASSEALTLMQDHVHDVVREHPWYRRYPIRARILYSQEFKTNGIGQLKEIVDQLDEENWHAGGLLNTLLKHGNKLTKLPWPCGQPFYLYLADNDDAVMLKLQAGDWIERFERQRKP